MTVLLDIEIPRTIDVLVERLSRPALRGARVEAWVFEDGEARAAAEAALARHGVRARFRSAYKPLVHHVLEEGVPEDASLRLRYPVRPEANPGRFLMEAYPLAALSRFGAFAAEPAGPEPACELLVDTRQGSTTHSVFLPNRLRRDALGRDALCPSAWLRVRGSADAVEDCDEPLASDYELAFDAVMAAVSAHRWPREEPFFDALRVRVEIGGVENDLPVFAERMSTREALHEELYFSLLEFFHRRSGRPDGDRTLRPGQIVPDIVGTEGPTRVRVTLATHEQADDPVAGPEADWAACDTPPPLAGVQGALDAFAGTPIAAPTRQGRTVRGVIVAGEGPPVLVTGGQHANETSGVVGALRAAAALRDAGAAFAVIPAENPDGYALHQQLIGTAPHHMHHAARYTALGDDLEYRVAPPFLEQAARNEAIRATGALLHINLHGYPAHEWTRPLSGYVPRGFEAWAIPKGFFLILRHHPGLDAYGLDFLERLTARLAEDAELAAFNAAQLAAYRAHAGAIGFPVLNGFACMMAERPAQPTPLQLITEYPDETIHGAAFRLAHVTQARAALFARDLLAEDVAGGRWPGRPASA
ncbi:peptidase M14 [Alsobacter soli]|uniref:Peptidase M14 n=1 Tax=Alsobacter soli TaxID=2109933 RepID=A0A2T1HZ65_9HYPH|nr:peptidase M14 [Alsobacter soli]PSC06880.1 peptidase M14 [Alsobacter soli]